MLAHFSLKEDAALVALPTGAGKTAVLALLPYLLGSERVLAIAPSRLVRDQIAGVVRDQKVLKRVGVLGPTAPSPVVSVIQTRKQLENVNELSASDIVVATPSVLWDASRSTVRSPAGLFDTILVDEAHHSPAATWSAILNAHGQSKKCLFTATPFRRDGRNLDAEFVFVYPLTHARRDGIFGEIEFQPAVRSENESADEAIARVATSVLHRDRECGRRHAMLVRVDSKSRAEALLEFYSAQTDLKLGVIHSNYSERHVNTVLRKVRAGSLDGVVAVAMLGEGIDLPELKVAAIHSPHKSLEVTLQFIGRFARPGDGTLGVATFVAEPNDIELERVRLYKDDAAWHELVTELADTRLQAEVRRQQAMRSFESRQAAGVHHDPISLYAIRPPSHVKIYEVGGEVDLTSQPALAASVQVVQRFDSASLRCAAFVLAESRQPRWCDSPKVRSVVHELLVVVAPLGSRFLFIGSTIRTVEFYDRVVMSFSQGDHAILPQHKMDRVLRGMRDLSCLNLGMRSLTQSDSVESYRIMSGTAVDNAVRPDDPEMFHRGHMFVRGVSSEGPLTVGYSSASKVWAAGNKEVADFVEWCGKIAGQLQMGGAVTTNTGIDALGSGEPIESLPELIGVAWNSAVFSKSVAIIDTASGEEGDILDCELTIARHDDVSADVVLEWNGSRVAVRYRPKQLLFFEYATEESAPAIAIRFGDEEMSLLQFLRNMPPDIYGSDRTRLSGRDLFRLDQNVAMYHEQNISTREWVGSDGKTPAECGADLCLATPVTIHDLVGRELLAEDGACVVYDHGSGEVADFVRILRSEDRMAIKLIHCKGNGRRRPRAQVADFYDLVGQAVKSSLWLRKPKSILERLLARNGSGAARIIQGNRAVLEGMNNQAGAVRSEVEVVLVQPGLSQSSVSESILALLGATEVILKRRGASRMTLIASA